MDVRCEKCQTEYELDEGKLKPGGVTVKCTTCGHMFKVRRRPSGHVSSAPLPPSDSMAMRAPLSNGDDGERTWLVRLEDGEIKTCRELSTLQKWIISGRVTRECAISRTGKKWKPLGEIGELASFFAIADEARQARQSGKWGGTVTKEYPKEEAKSGGHPRTVPRRSSHGGGGGEPGGGGGFSAAASRDGAPVQDLLDTLQDLKQVPGEEVKPGGVAAAVATAGMNPIFTRTLPLGTPLPPSMRSGNNATGRPAGPSRPVDDQPTISAPEESAALARAAEQASEALGRPPIGSPSPAAVMPAQPIPGPSTAGWAAQGRVGGEMSSGESGPTAGTARPSRAGEAAFVSAKQAGKLPDIRGEYENGRFVPTYYTEDDLVIPRGNRVALWIILISLVLLAGAAIAVYMFLYTGGDDDDEAATAQKPAAASLDAGAAPTAPTQPIQPPPGLEQAVAAAALAVTADADAGLEAAAQNLAGLASQPGATASGPFLVARARVENALGQRLADRAKLAATPGEAKTLADKARARADAAKAAANAALAIEGDHKAAAEVALADAQRLAGEKTVEVERILRQARQGPPAATAEVVREADLATALLMVRDDRLRDARLQLDPLAKQAPSGDVRAAFRLAWLDFLDGNAVAAKAGAEAVLAAQPEHGAAKALLDKLGAAAAPPPGESKPTGEKPPAEKPPVEKPTPPKPPAEETTGSILKRANKLAENGNCDGAMPLYRKVLDETPSSVEALTGLGFCHLDRKEYASAHTRFRAALGISSHYQDAMWGIAELYQRQGNKEEAIAKYQEFVEAFPSSKRATAARRQIDKLRGDSAESSGGGGGESSGEETGPPPEPQVDESP